MHLIKYRDEMNGEVDYSFFWVHTFKDGTEKVVSPVFQIEEDALRWGDDLKKRIEEYSAHA
jgi:hypothetical protein